MSTDVAMYVAKAVSAYRLIQKMSQAQLAANLGAAGKAVVDRWESGKRKPSPVFWLRIERLRQRAGFPTVG